MKKILLIFILLPSLGFGQCLLINEETFIGAEIFFSTEMDKLSKNGIIIGNDGVMKEEHSWNYNNYILEIKRTYDCNYFFDLSSGISNGEVVKTWAERNGKRFVSKLITWQKFDSDYYDILVGDINYRTCINYFISERIKIWEKKGEFEKTITFKERVNEKSRKIKSDELEKQAINFYKKNIIDNILYSEIVLKEYNADNETFNITIGNFEAINFPVPISKAENFKKNFDPSNFSNLDFIYAQDEFIVSKIDFDGSSYDLFSQE